MSDADDDPGCLHCMLGKAIVARIGPDPDLWQQDAVQRIVEEIVLGFAGLLVKASQPDHLEANLANVAKMLSATALEYSSARRVHMH